MLRFPCNYSLIWHLKLIPIRLYCCIWLKVLYMRIFYFFFTIEQSSIWDLCAMFTLLVAMSSKVWRRVFHSSWSFWCGHTSFIIHLWRTLCERFGKQSWTCCHVRKWPRAVWYQVRWPWWTPSLLFLPLAAREPFCVWERERKNTTHRWAAVIQQWHIVAKEWPDSYKTLQPIHNHVVIYLHTPISWTKVTTRKIRVYCNSPNC